MLTPPPPLSPSLQVVASASDVPPAAAGVFRVESTVEGLGRVAIAVERAAGGKCDRCWTYSTAVGSSTEHPLLCERCEPVVRSALIKPFATPAAA